MSKLDISDPRLLTKELVSPRSVNDHHVDLRDYLQPLVRLKWRILLIILLFFALFTSYAFLATPIYQADVLIQLKQNESGINTLQDISSIVVAEPSLAATEIEIIKSHSVLARVIEDHRLDIIAKPKYFPLFGRHAARIHETASDRLNEPWLGFSSFAWGGEFIQINQLELPLQYVDQDLKLVVGDSDNYFLYGPGGRLIIQGTVGRLVISDTHVGEALPVRVEISTLRARAGTQFQVQKKSYMQSFDDLQERLTIKEIGLKTGILRLSLEGPHPEENVTILNSIARIYVGQDIARKSEEVVNTLQFLEGQLPLLKKNLESAEAKLNEHRLKFGSINLEVDNRALLDKIAEIATQISRLELMRVELKTKFTTEHEAMKTLEQKIRQLKSEQKLYNERLKKLPGATLEALRVSRDVKVATEIYLLVLNKAKSTEIAKSGIVSDVSIIDKAIVSNIPDQPKKLLLISAGILLGTLIGIVYAYISGSLNTQVEDPATLEKQINLPVYAVIPHSGTQVKLSKGLTKKEDDGPVILAGRFPEDSAVEGIRSLRTTLQFILPESGANIVTLSSPGPNAGKSFLSVNLAHLMNNSGKKILLIDADFRKASLHHYLAVPRSPGLSEVIDGAVDFYAAAHCVNQHRGSMELENKSFDFLPAGELPKYPSEMLSSDRFSELIRHLSAEYDAVIIDSPPVIVTDATIIARNSSVNFLVVRSGRQTMQEIEISLKKFSHAGARVNGLIFNGMRERSSYGYNYQYNYG